MNIQTSYTVSRIASTLAQIDNGCDPKQAVKALLVEFLPQKQRNLLAVVATMNTMSSKELAMFWSIDIRLASNLLTEMWKLGLLDREKQPKPQGQRGRRSYIYWPSGTRPQVDTFRVQP